MVTCITAEAPAFDRSVNLIGDETVMVFVTSPSITESITQ